MGTSSCYRSLLVGSVLVSAVTALQFTAGAYSARHYWIIVLAALGRIAQYKVAVITVVFQTALANSDILPCVHELGH